MKLIKRYKNRKFYDCETHRYVTLKDVINFVKTETDFRVINHKNMDVTNETLMSALVSHVDVDNVKDLVKFGDLK